MVLLEAQDRVGGRVLTHSTDGSEAVELGAEFIHGRPKATLDLMRAAGIELVSLNSEHRVLINSRLERMDDELGGLQDLFKLARKEKADRSVASFLDEVGKDPALAESASWMRNVLQGFDAADPERASLQTVVKEWAGEAGIEAEQGRPGGGYGPLIDFMLKRLDPSLVELRLGSPVTGVRWRRSGVELDVAGGAPVAADAAIITVPLSVLQLTGGSASAIRFDPPLTAKAPALAGLAMGPVHRVMIRFSTPPWETHFRKPMRAGTFLHAPDQPFRTFWTSEPGSGWLTAWCGGPPAARIGALPDDIIVGQAVASARSMFAELAGGAPEPVEVQFHNWQRDPWSLGGYTYVAVGGLGARKALAEPLDGVLFFAGEATEWTGEAATVAGAIMSGERAAKDLAASSVGP